MRRVVLLTLVLVVAQAVSVLGAGAQDRQPAFPSAQGFGANTTGGRGGEVVIVSTLEASGPGSLAEALAPRVCGPRIVVFAVSGVIDGDLELACGDVTVAGQTAPGAGITIRGRIDGYGADPAGNIVLRHLRVRPGEPDRDEGRLHDAIQLSNNRGVVLDHVSVSWAADEVIDLFEGASDITIQWSTIEESRTQGHPEGTHNFGAIIGPGVPGVSIHHTLFAHHRARCPAVAAGPAEVINNVIYNCRDGFVHHNPARGEFHIIANTFRSGPGTDLLTPVLFDDEDPGDVAYYLTGNRIDDPPVFDGIVDDIWRRPAPHPGLEQTAGERFAIDAPTDFTARHPQHRTITVEGPDQAFEAVLTSAGAFPRDTVTRRTISEVRGRTGRWGSHEPDDLLDGLNPAQAPQDSDADGMPDQWEQEHGLNPDDGTDHNTVLASGYTAIETYINELADNLTAPPSTSPPPEPVPTAGTTPQADRDIPVRSSSSLLAAAAAIALTVLTAVGLAVVVSRRTPPPP